MMLADIWPTGYHAVELSGFKPGESIVIYGCGPVGLMAAYSALLTGQAHVKRYNRLLSHLIEGGRATPSFIVSHELSLEEAPDAYAHFNARDTCLMRQVLGTFPTWMLAS